MPSADARQAGTVTTGRAPAQGRPNRLPLLPVSVLSPQTFHEEAIMRTLSKLAILLAGLAVAFWAPAAKAHCPHGNSTNQDHCPGDPPPPGAPSFVVMDCADLLCVAPPKRVGTVVEVGQQALGKVVVLAEFEDSLGDIRSVGLCVTELQIRGCGGGDVVWFDELNCGGKGVD